jgi:hypothetical protein
MIVSKRIALAVGGAAAAAVLGTAGIAAAAGSPTGDTQQITAAASTTAAPSPETKDRAKHPRLAKLARGLHGEFVAKGKDGKLVTIVTVKGEFTAVSPTSVTVKAEDGYTATFAIGGDTKVRGKGIADVKVGDTGAAAGVKGAGGITARTVLVRTK